MAGVMTFITVVEKILIIICILCFIPTSVFVFAPKDHTFSAQQIAIYQNAHKQVFSPFIIGYNANNCTFKEAVLNNDYCFKKADSTSYSVKWTQNFPICSGYFYQYNNLQFCSGISEAQGGIILNQFQTGANGTITFQHSDQVYPIFSISTPLNNPTINYYHYAPDGLDNLCKIQASQLTLYIQNKFSNLIYKPYETSSRFLWYTTLPTLAVMLGLIVMNELSNQFNLRKYVVMSCFCLNVALLALIIKGIVYYSQTLSFKVLLGLLSLCFVQGQKATLQNMSNIDLGVTFGFVFFIGIVALLIFLSMVLQLIAKLVELKYYRVREGISQQDIQLSDLKASLRSRRMVHNNSLTSKSSKMQRLDINQ